MNVIGTRPDGWWRDRDGAMSELVGRLTELDDDACVVFDHRPRGAAPRAAGVTVLFAPRPGRDAADHEIVRELERRGGAARSTRVVTSDRALAVRAQELGAAVIGSGEFLRLLDSQV